MRQSSSARPSRAAALPNAAAGPAIRFPRALIARSMLLAIACVWLFGAVPVGAAHSMPARQPLAARQAAVCTQSGRNVVGQSLTIDENEWVCGNVSVYGGSVTVLGRVDGDVLAVGGDVSIAGRVGGNVRAIGGNVELHAGADVAGTVQVVGGSIYRDQHTQVGGGVENDTMQQHSVWPMGWMGQGNRFSFPWFSVLFWALAGAFLVRFFPEQVGRVRSIARGGFAQSLAAGVLVALAAGIFALILFVTCIGIPLALGLLVGLWLAWVTGTVAIGYWLGERLLHGLARSSSTPITATLLGVTLLALGESIPCIGGLLGLVVGCAGVGATALTLLHSRQFSARGWRPN